MLRGLETGKGDVGIWSENATYTTEQSEIDDSLLRKYHPVCDGDDRALLEDWRKQWARSVNKRADKPHLRATRADFSFVVKNLKNGKACGGDAISNEALKATAQAMIAKLDTLYTC